MDDSYKSLERKSLEQTSTRLPEPEKAPKPKEGRSVFDDLLEQSMRLTQNALQNRQGSKTETQQAIPGIQREREKERERSKDGEKDSSQQKQEERSEKQGDGKKVLGRPELKQQQEHSGGGNFQGGGREGSKDSKRSHLSMKKSSVSELQAKASVQQFAAQLQAKISQAANGHLKTIPNEIMNQIVKLIRVKSFQDGAHVCEVDCRDGVFLGLSLRFAASHGKVKVQFLTGNPETKALFEREAGNIGNALRAKGVVVEEIRIL